MHSNTHQRRLSCYWIRICPNQREIVIIRKNSSAARVQVQERRVYRNTTDRQIERMRRFLWRWNVGGLYWTAYRPEHPEHAEMYAN